MRFVTTNLAARTHSYMMDTLCALTIVFPSVLCVCSFCMYTNQETHWSTWIVPCLQLRTTTSSSTTTVSMVMRITIRGRIFHKGGGDDAEHPTFIPMYTLTTLQAPRGHMTRPRIYTIGHKVNSLLSEPSLSTCETWLLPHAWILHILRYDRDDHGESKDQGQAWKRRRKRTWPLQNRRYYRWGSGAGFWRWVSKAPAVVPEAGAVVPVFGQKPVEPVLFRPCTA